MVCFTHLFITSTNIISKLYSPVADELYYQWLLTDEATALEEKYKSTIELAYTLLNFTLNLYTLEDFADSLVVEYSH